MGKTAQCIKMLEILNSGRIYKTSELASMLETNTRNIIEYRKELEECGYYIISIPGRYGGYQLDVNNVMPVLTLTNKEKEVLLESYEYINSKNDFMNKEILDNVIGKIKTGINSEESYEPVISGQFYKLSMSNEKIKERYDFFNKTIRNKNICEITYDNLKYGPQKLIIHPYQLFNYKNAWFLLALNPKVGKMWQFKLNRIIEYNKTDKKFIRMNNFNLNEYFKETGFINKEEKFHLEVLVRKVVYNLFRERIYGENQVIEEVDDDWHRVNVDVQNINFIRDFILSCGCDLKVIQPLWLKEDIIKNINKSLELYKD